MSTELSKLQWIEILQLLEITSELELSIFQALYPFDNHAALVSEIGRILGYLGKPIRQN